MSFSLSFHLSSSILVLLSACLLEPRAQCRLLGLGWCSGSSQLLLCSCFIADLSLLPSLMLSGVEESLLSRVVPGFLLCFFGLCFILCIPVCVLFCPAEGPA